MKFSYEMLFILFIVYSFLGWLIEVINELVTCHRFVNRGFLIGPYCPIYGCGGVLITLLLSKYAEHPITLFILAIIICSVLEYLTSLVMEKMFKLRWWDYSNRKYNLNGRICAETMIPFGLLGTLMIYVINPLIFKLIGLLDVNTLKIVAMSILFIFVLDLFTSVYTLVSIKSDIKSYEKDNTAEISTKIKEFLFNKDWLHRRILRSYPNLKLIIKENINRMISKERYEQEKIKIETEAKIQKIKLDSEYKISRIRKKAEEKLNKAKKHQKN